MRGYTPPTLPEEEAIIYGDDGSTPLTILQEYLFNLIRRSMNRKTGIAGDKSRISWGGLYERAYEDLRQGYNGTGDAWGKTRDKRILYIRNQVRRIEKLGLIKLVSNKGGSLQIEFVIFNKYRSLYFSDQNKVTSNLPLEVTTNLPPETTNNNNELAKDEQREVTTPESAKVTTYPEVSRDTYKQTDRGEAARFSITQDWRPSPAFTDMAKLSMLDIEQEHQQLYSETLAEFLMFWTSEEAAERYPNRLRRTQGEWERGLLTQVQSAKANPKQRKATSSGSRPRSRYTTKQDVIRARNQQTATGWIPPELREGANP